MPIEVIAPIVALGGVMISVLVSYLVSVRQTKSEFQKLRIEIRKEVGNKLFEKRLEVYPELYALVSGFVKIVQFGKVSNAAVNNFISKWQEWDSQNSIFFSRVTGHINYELRRMFIDMAKKTDDEIDRDLSSTEALKDLRKKLGQLEIALKHELGVFEIETPLILESPELRDEYDKYDKASANSRT